MHSRADHGQEFVPGAGPSSEAPQDLDHFKRGHDERSNMRERDSENMDDRITSNKEPGRTLNFEHPKYPPAAAAAEDRDRDYRGGSSSSGGRGGHDDRRAGGCRGGGGGGDDYRGGSRSYSGGRGGGRGRGRGGPPPGRNRDDMTFREYRRYMEENPQLQEEEGGGGRGGPRRGGYNPLHGGAPHIIKGMDIQALVDRLQRANNQADVDQELEIARDKHRDVFDSGKALTAIISSVARRRNMNLAKAIWDWIDHVGIPKNTFHYNSMISACEKVKDYRRALQLLDEMKAKNIDKNEVTYVQKAYR